MNKIIYHNEPFTFQQTIYFLGENDYKETIYTTNVDVVSEIKNLLNRYPETKEIELYGVENILKQYKAEILTNFENTSNIEITINKGE